jgi:hypothetical protein
MNLAARRVHPPPCLPLKGEGAKNGVHARLRLRRLASAAGEVLLEGEEFARRPGSIGERGIGQRRQ